MFFSPRFAKSELSAQIRGARLNVPTVPISLTRFEVTAFSPKKTLFMWKMVWLYLLHLFKLKSSLFVLVARCLSAHVEVRSALWEHDTHVPLCSASQELWFPLHRVSKLHLIALRSFSKENYVLCEYLNQPVQCSVSTWALEKIPVVAFRGSPSPVSCWYTTETCQMSTHTCKPSPLKGWIC